MSLEEVASWILCLEPMDISKARNAYSDFLYIPGWNFLKYAQCIQQAAKLSNVSGATYADFWDASRALKTIIENVC